MTQVLELGLAPEDLLGMANKAKESLSKPGVAVQIPSPMMYRIEEALQGLLSDQLLAIREQTRSITPESLSLRIR